MDTKDLPSTKGARVMQLDLFEWAAARPRAKILDWYEPFAKRVMAHIHEYDDDWPKPYRDDNVVDMPMRKSSAKSRR